jgi:hypothetical protein
MKGEAGLKLPVSSEALHETSEIIEEVTLKGNLQERSQMDGCAKTRRMEYSRNRPP